MYRESQTSMPVARGFQRQLPSVHREERKHTNQAIQDHADRCRETSRTGGSNDARRPRLLLDQKGLYLADPDSTDDSEYERNYSCGGMRPLPRPAAPPSPVCVWENRSSVQPENFDKQIGELEMQIYLLESDLAMRRNELADLKYKAQRQLNKTARQIKEDHELALRMSFEPEPFDPEPRPEPRPEPLNLNAALAYSLSRQMSTEEQDFHMARSLADQWSREDR